MSVELADRPARTSRTADPFTISIGAIALLQAIWLWATIGRGWYLQSDLSNLADTSGRSLSWSYLRSPLGGHFAPVLRAAYWLMQGAAPMSYGLTIAVRVLLQTGAILLLGRLLYLLIGRSAIIPVVLAGFSLSSLTLPGLTFMTTGLAFGIAQLFGVASLLVLLRFVRTGRLADGLLVGALIALATLASEQFIVYALLAALLASGFCYAGTARNRLKQALRHWLGWLAMALPVAGAVVAALLGADTRGAGGLRAADIWPLLRSEWLRSFGPSLIGGPFRWFADDHTYVAFYAPGDATILLGQLAFVLLVLLGWYFTGRQSLMAWSLPIVAGLVGILLVAAARYGEAGLLIPVTPRYSYVIAVPLAMAIGLSLGAPSGSARTLDLRLPRSLGNPVVRTTTIGVAVIVAMCVSSVRYTHFWSHNPGRSYAATLLASARAGGPTVSVYDTALPPDLVSAVEPNHHVSDLFRLLKVSASFDQSGSAPLVVTREGRLVKAAFVSVAHAAAAPVPRCGTPINGTGTFDIPLSKPVNGGEWFLHLDLYQQRPSELRIHVVSQNAVVLSPAGGSLVKLGPLASINLRLPPSAPVTVQVSSTGPAVHLCLVNVLIGAPFPASAK